MGYYRGDGSNYYRGDYYRGDPFIGALVGGAVRAVAGGAVGKAIKKAGRWVGARVGGAAAAAAPVLREAAPSAVAGAVGYTMGGGRMPSLPALGPLDPGGARLPWIGERKKYRRMNPLNPKALRRALRRAEGFEKFAKRTVNALHTGPRKFKSTRRRSS